MAQLHLWDVSAQAPIPISAPPPADQSTRARSEWEAAEAFRVLDETADFLLVEKPPGVLIHPTKPGGPRTLWDALCELLAYEIVTGRHPGILTRLDRETSGIVLVGKGRQATARLGHLLATGQMQKEYHALVFGWPQEAAWTVNAPLRRLGEVEPTRVWLRRGVHHGGAPARTDFRVLRRIGRDATNGFAVIAARPHTGRTHQIRVHLAHSGHPIVGDKLYAKGEECYLRFIAEGWTPALQALLLHPRQALHACALGFDDSSIRHRWESPWPTDLRKLEEQCRSL